MTKRILSPLVIACLLGASSQVFASDFNLPFVNAAGLGTSYSDWATSAADASTTFTNPAGLVKLEHQQIVFAPIAIWGNTSFTGSTATPPYAFPGRITQSGSATSKIFAFMPSFYYAKPLTDRVTFGFGETVPFALGTNYSKDSIVRYAATRSQIVVIDFTPSIGFKVNDQIALGVGLDASRMTFTLNNMYGPPVSTPDGEGQNHLAGWGYGWHGGILYQALKTTRVGLSFNSSMMFHTTGDSEFYSPTGATWRTTNQKSNAMLPARTQLSAQHDLNACLTVMATIFYTNWSSLPQLTMKRVMGNGGTTSSVTIPFNYHNTFDYAAGLSYKLTPKWILRTGFTILNTPSNNRNRGVSDPIGRATIVGLGAHYQQNPCLSYDMGYEHSFFRQEQVNLATPLTLATGHNNTQTNVIGAQINWNFI